MAFSHIPVLLGPCLEGLAIRPEGIYVDATAGGGGHSFAIVQCLTTGRLIALDKDPDAVQAAAQRLSAFPNATVLHTEYAEMDSALDSIGVGKVNGVLMDIGVSSYQLDTPERGFSYHVDAPLDMRMSQQGLSAWDVVNSFRKRNWLVFYGSMEKRNAPAPLPENFAAVRQQKTIDTTLELAELVKSAVPAKMRKDKNPAKRSFQAIRIAVNNELDNLRQGLDSAFERLEVQGRLAVITFHSLEDRIVKQAFQGYCTGCTCPPDFPICVCGKKPRGRLVNRKPIEADSQELEQNPRSHSAKLRVIEKL